MWADVSSVNVSEYLPEAGIRLAVWCLNKRQEAKSRLEAYSVLRVSRSHCWCYDSLLAALH